MKKLICFVLILTMLFGLLPTHGVLAAETISEPQHTDQAAEDLSSYYGYSRLKNEAERKAYAAIQRGVQKKAEKVSLGELSLTGDDVEKVYEIYLNDHPEAYYLGDVYWLGSNGSGTVADIKFSYSDDKYDDGLFDAGCAEILQSVGSAETEYGKALALHDLLARHITYDLDAPNAHNAYGAIVGGRAVCDGYSRAYQYLLRKLGIQSYLATGSGQGGPHAWNLLRLDGEYYFADVTWDDQEGSEEKDDSWIAHAYFAQDTETMSEDHVLEDPCKIIENCPARKLCGGLTELDTLTVEAVASAIRIEGEQAVAHLYYTGTEDLGVWLSDTEGGIDNMSRVAEASGKPIKPGTGITIAQIQHEYRISYPTTAKHVHVPVPVEGREPTHTEDGYKAYYQCACGKYFEDEACTREITDLAAWKKDAGKIPAVGHSFVPEWHYNAAGHWQECTCGARTDPEKHTFTESVREDGTKVFTCSVCGYSYTEQPVPETGNVKIDAASFPDDAFRKYVSDNFDLNQDGILTPEERKQIQYINLTVAQDQKGDIKSLKGIEYFTELKSLYCNNHQITELDLSHNTKIDEINCDNNQISVLDLSHNPDVVILYCSNNHLVSLNIRSCGKLQSFGCENNLLAELNISSPNMQRLNCRNNRIFSLDLSCFTELEELDCSCNYLSGLDIGGCPNLQKLDCAFNNLSGLDVSANGKLTRLYISENRLPFIDLSHNPDLTGNIGGSILYTCTGKVSLSEFEGIDTSKISGLKNLRLEGTELIVTGDYPEYVYDAGNGHAMTVQINKGHNLQWVAEIPAGKDRPGRMRYGICTQCGKKYLTPESKFEVDEKDLIVPALNDPGRRNIPVTEENFPDEKFRWYVANYIDTDSNGYLSDEELNMVQNLNIEHICAPVGEDQVSTMKGISYFTRLIELICVGQNVTSLDLSQNDRLLYLDCSCCKIDSLTFPENSPLKEFLCIGNQLTHLDISMLKNLTYLECGQNELGTLNIQDMPALETMNCSQNQLTELNISNCPKLTALICSYNKLNGMDADCTQLAILDCGSNSIAELNLEAYPMLNALDCSKNGLISLDISHNPALEQLFCGDNKLSALDVTNNPALEELSLSYNHLETLDVSQNPALKALNCTYNDRFSRIDLTHNPELMNFSASFDCLTELDLHANTKLENLFCEGNRFTELDVSHNLALKELFCSCNCLKHLDLSHNEKLEILCCNENELQELNLNHNPALRVIRCRLNPFTELDVSKLANLVSLEVGPFENLQIQYCPDAKYEVISLFTYPVSGIRCDNIPGFDRDQVTDLQGGTIENGQITIDGTYIVYEMFNPHGYPCVEFNIGDCLYQIVHSCQLEYVPQVEPTEQSDGMCGHYRCPCCGRLFKGPDGYEEVTEEDLILPRLPAKPHLTSDVFTVSGGFISNIPAGTTADQLLDGLTCKESCTISDGESVISGDTPVGTGMTVSLAVDGSTIEQATIVINGDVNGDGKITITDLLLVKTYLLEASEPSKVQAAAADTNGDGEVSITDFVQIKSDLLGKKQIKPRPVR